MLVGWVPFLQPLPDLVGGWYLLCIPIVVGVAMVYKAVWLPQDAHWGRQVFVMSLWMMIGMVGLAIALALLTQWVIPNLA